eukprot:TRINITY_DN24926_c0_g1_i4.p2 TRINITY_DN24926_c0_g1~~TRINITY_DN24926_c0_g1_i4.p2  ORF type:complete len:113 (-),score=33.36 TRINITY_DN24926_c0_g1_i4:143-481(-)
MMGNVQSAIGNVTSVAVALSYPSELVVPSMVMNGYKNMLAIAVATEYSFPLADKIKEMLENPEAFLAQMAAAAPVGGGEAAAAPAAAEEKKAPEPESEEDESDDDMGFSLFD